MFVIAHATDPVLRPGEPGRIVKKFECVLTFPVVLRTRPGLGQKVITVCTGYATVCGGTIPV